MKQKLCTNCNRTKNYSEFATNPSKKDGFSWQCKECQAKYFREWYQKNKNKVKANTKKWWDKTTKTNELIIISHLKEHPCVDCGETNILLLDFDHVRDTKCKSISVMCWGSSTETLKTEMAKCEIRCANCHRLKSLKETGSWKFNYLDS